MTKKNPNKTTWKLCTECNREVKLNGVGSDANMFTRFFMWLARKTVPNWVLWLFRDPSEDHDMDYHCGPRTPSKESRKFDRLIADNKFDDANRSKAYTQTGRRRKKALKWATFFYKTLRSCGGMAYPKYACSHPKRKFHKGATRSPKDEQTRNTDK